MFFVLLIPSLFYLLPFVPSFLFHCFFSVTSSCHFFITFLCYFFATSFTAPFLPLLCHFFVTSLPLLLYLFSATSIALFFYTSFLPRFCHLVSATSFCHLFATSLPFTSTTSLQLFYNSLPVLYHFFFTCLFRILTHADQCKRFRYCLPLSLSPFLPLPLSFQSP